MYYLLINYKTISSPCPGGSDNAHFRVRERLMRQINWKKRERKGHSYRHSDRTRHFPKISSGGAHCVVYTCLWSLSFMQASALVNNTRPSIYCFHFFFRIQRLEKTRACYFILLVSFQVWTNDSCTFLVQKLRKGAIRGE